MVQDGKSGATRCVSKEEHTGISTHKHGGLGKQGRGFLQCRLVAEIHCPRAGALNTGSGRLVIPTSGEDYLNRVLLDEPPDIPNVGIDRPVAPGTTTSSAGLKDDEIEISKSKKVKTEINDRTNF